MTHNSNVFKEIYNQPSLWKATYELVLAEKEQLGSFLNNVLARENLEIILTEAGSSAFIGKILQQAVYKATAKTTKAIPTTDLVTHPEGYFQKNVPTLLVSFARSGDSPESLATFDLAEKLYSEIYHLIITCNAEGALTRKARNKENTFVFLMPDDANDQSLAMTGAFTSMTLAGFLIADIKNIHANKECVKKLKGFGTTILGDFSARLSEIAGLDFKRVVLLGSGPLQGAANESSLKILELTDGQIICQYDSFLGFRHGPRAAIDESTLLVYLFSSNPYVYKYEVDLVNSINSNEHFLYSIGISQCLSNQHNPNVDLSINLCSGETKIPDDVFAICSVIPAQILGYYKSLFLGLTPDSPSQNGGINRIVQGVTIYPY